MAVAARLSLVLVLSVLLPAAYAQEIRFDGGRFLVHAWKAPAVPPPGGWESLLRVHVGAVIEGTPAMLGTYAVENGTLSFRPRFPITPGVSVTAVFTPVGAAHIERSFEVPKRAAAASTRVAGIYPSASLLPENLLKLYVEFSTPMSQGEAWRHLRLLDASGRPVDLPFLEIEQELWDADGKRLTVLFDPGRIKRGVLPLVETGPALEAGKQYTLLVSRDWRDATGSPLAAETRKLFRVAKADRKPIQPARWGLTPPVPGTRDPLVIRFGEPLDYALLAHMIRVAGVAGVSSAGAEEREWRFVPDEAWRAGQYNVVIDTRLEDLAGNRVGRAFDVDTFERITNRIAERTVSLPFRIGGQ